MIRLIIFVVVTSAISIPQVPIWAADAQSVAKADCPDECGGVQIPYPFGIGDGCYFNTTVNGTSYGKYYQVTCDTSLTDNPLRITDSNNSLLSISLDDHSFRINSPVGYDCYDSQGSDKGNYYQPYLPIVEFSISPTRNKFVATGCDTKASIEGARYGRYYYTGCMSYCTSLDSIVNGTCNGVGCCEAPVPDGATNISTKFNTWNYHNNSPFNPCSSGFIVEDGAFNFSTFDLTAPASYFKTLSYPMVFEWSIVGNGSCAHQSIPCGSNTACVDRESNSTGYRCKCLSGYTGNPYFSQGCQDIDECKSSTLNQCEKPGYCLNTVGAYECKCPRGSHGKGTKTDGCTSQGWNSLPAGAQASVGIAIGLVLLLIGGIFVRLYYEKKKLLDLKKSFFEKNGGLILNQKLSGQDISVQKFKIFTTDELEIATANFSERNVVGRGGFGMVYKGILPDGQEVAIKKSLKVDPDQIDQFVNETLVLSEINNRNVVKLLGCCLDAEVPLLVYEFINNGTLYEHLHDEEKASLLSLDIRLSIAEAVASVLNYLHTTIVIPIIHRDMKSMNILLDENYTAKVSDFGASKLVPSDQDQLATVVLGTCGYLDPEYMQTHELTQKSDVYSFGVVLLELLTRKKAIAYNLPEMERSLAMHFLTKMKEDRLVDIIDPAILINDSYLQVKRVAELASRCLRLKGDERPTMKEAATELESIKNRGKSTSYSIVELLPEESHTIPTYPVEDNEGNSTPNISSTFPSRMQQFDGGR